MLSSCRRLLAFAAAIFYLLALAGSSHAETLSGSYKSSALRDGTGKAYSCMSRSGGTDGAGTAYLPCHNYIYVVDVNGRLTNAIRVPNGLPARRDVAVTTNGDTVYYVSGAAIIDDPAGIPGVGAVQKMVRGRDGVYRHDASFKVGPIQFGAVYRSVRNIDVDLNGRLYASSNAYVFIFNSAGRRISAFGGDDKFVNGRYTQGLEVAKGIAVTRDGMHVYVVEQRHNHVQRWDRTFDGGWKRAAWKLGSYTEVSNCSDTHRFASPYDVGLDGAGNIMVLDVTCRRIQRFTPAGAFAGTVWQNYTNAQVLYHGFAVDYRGNVIVPERGRRFSYQKTLTGCRPDYSAPNITSVVAPRSTGRRAVNLTIKGRDACSAVRAVRIYGATSTGTAWRSPRAGGTTITAYLTGGVANKTIYVAMRDSYGRIGTRAITIRYTATGKGATAKPPAGGAAGGNGNGNAGGGGTASRRVRARATVNFGGTARYCLADPLANLANGSSYRLADRCATIRAKLVSKRTSNGTTSLRVRVSSRIARRLYENSRGPVYIWVIGRSSTPQPRRMRVGSDIVVTGAFVTDQGRNWVALAPVGQWYRR